MAEGSVSSNEPPLKKLRPQEEILRFRWLRGPCGFLQIERIQDVPISSPIRNLTIRDVPTLCPIKKTTIRDELQSLNFVLRFLVIQGVTISSSWLSSLSSSLSSLKFLQINEFVWSLGLGDLRSLPTLYEDWVNKKRSNTDREEDNHVSSGNNDGRLDDDSGSNDVRLDGGIEEQQRRAGETPGPSTVISPTKQKKRRKSTVISRGTDGLESFVQSVMLPFLRQVVDEWGNYGNWERMLGKFDLENALRNTPSCSDLLKKITDSVCSEFPRLLQLRDRNPSLSSKDLKVYCILLCWSLKKRVDFWSDLSDKLFSRANAPNTRAKLKELKLELERTWQLHFRWERIDKIDEKWIKKYGEKWRQYFGKKWFHKIDERWIQKNGRTWIDKIDRKWIRIIKPKHRPWDSNGIFVRDLLRFIRNRRHHLDKFQETQGFHSSAESFYRYFDKRFPNLLMVTYGVAYQFCRDEPWFKKYS